MIGAASLRVVVAGALAACAPEEHVIGRGPASEERAIATCPQFEPGTNMLPRTWSEDPQESARVATVVQIVGDSAAGTTRVVSEIFDACRSLAIALGNSPDAPSIPPTIDEAREACDAAIDGVEGLQAADVDLTAEVEAISTPCSVQAAIAECTATCEDGDTCLDFCTSSVPWTADCPDAAVFITFSKEVGESYVGSWEAVEETTGQIIAVRSRLFLASQSLARLASIPSTSYRIDESCVPRVIDTLSETSEGNELADATIDRLLLAIEVREGSE